LAGHYKLKLHPVLGVSYTGITISKEFSVLQQPLNKFQVGYKFEVIMKNM